MMRTRVRTFVAGLACLLMVVAVPAGAHGQGVTTSAITGRVTESSGQPLTAAQVMVTNPESGTTNGGLTDNDGRYYIPYLRPGVYTVSAQSIGHRTITREGIRVTLGQDQRVDFILPEEAVQLSGIEVTAESNPTFSPSKTGAQTVITEDALNSLPTITRNFSDFAVLSPLVQTSGDAPSVGGANNRFNNIQIDGAVNNDVFGLAASGLPGGQANGKAVSMDAVKEFQVLVAPFDVRQAGFTGGLINAVTKSGTNQFKGSAFVYYRNQNFIGDVNVSGRTLSADEFKSAQYGFTLGGPIQQDKLHFFVSAELEKYDHPTLDNINTAGPAAVGVNPDSMSRFVNILEGYGANPGTQNGYTLQNPLNNFLGRIDWQLNQNNRFTLRDSYNTATDDDSPSRGGFYYELSSYTYQFKNKTNSLVGQLYSTINSSLYNELLVNWERVRDRRNPLVDYGTVVVNTTNTVDGNDIGRRFEAGAEYYSQGNELDQDIFEFTDNLTRTMGGHKITLGTSNQYFHFRNLFFPGSYGRWTFNSLADFAENNPSKYEVAVPFPGVSDVAATFGVFQAGGYIQDEWTVNEQLSLTGGLRVDVPFMLDDPRENPIFAQETGLHTGTIPSGNALWSPRVGFNWRSTGASMYRTQIRGGVGIFSGRPPYVWMSNAYGNTGRDQVGITCYGSNAPAFSSSSTPQACADGTGATAGGTSPLVNIFSDDFKFPQDLKVSLAVDQDLPYGFTGTLEGLYTKAVNAIFLQDINIGSQVGTSSGDKGLGVRPVYGPKSQNGYSATPVYSSFDQIVEGTNTTAPYSYALVAELKKRFGELLDMRASYTYQRSYDSQSLTSSIATSNYGYNPVSSDPNNPDVTPSAFDRPHKIMLSGTLHLFPQYGGTDLSAIYVGQSGRNYNYMYAGDVNGDGYPGNGVAYGRDNDLIYIPTSAGDITMASQTDYQLLDQLIAMEPCLSGQRGHILERNTCRGPWTNNLNVRLEQGVPAGYGNVKIIANVFNFLNLLNGDWGLQKGAIYNTNDLLGVKGRDSNGNLIFSYAGRTTKDANGNTVADLPYTTFFPSSAWQLQLGVRYSF